MKYKTCLVYNYFVSVVRLKSDGSQLRIVFCPSSPGLTQPGPSKFGSIFIVNLIYLVFLSNPTCCFTFPWWCCKRMISGQCHLFFFWFRGQVRDSSFLLTLIWTPSLYKDMSHYAVWSVDPSLSKQELVRNNPTAFLSCYFKKSCNFLQLITFYAMVINVDFFYVDCMTHEVGSIKDLIFISCRCHERWD